MQQRLLVLLALVAVVVSIVFFRVSSRNDGLPGGVVAGRPAERFAPQEPSGVAVPTLSENRGEVLGPSKANRAVPDPERMDALVQGATVEGIVVSGVVRHSADGSRAGGVELILDHGGGITIVRADAGGAYRTASVVRAGVVTLRHRPTDPDGAYPIRLAIDSNQVTLAADTGEDMTLDVVLLTPPATLLVDVVYLDGRSAPDATVEFEQRRESASGDLRHDMDRADTDRTGRARFAIYDPSAIRAAGVIARPTPMATSRPQPSLSSEFRLLEMPLHAASLDLPVRLVLDATGTIMAQVVTGDGSPAPDQRVFIDDPVPDLGWWTDAFPVTDASGRTRVAGLPAGTYRVSVIGASADLEKKVTVHPGEPSEVTIVLPVREMAVAVSGLVLDEAGQPDADAILTIRFGPRDGPGESSASVATDTAGRFVARAAPSEWLSITAGRGVFADVYEPAVLEVPFGTTDVEFRRIREVPLEKVTFEIVDARTNELVPDVLVMTYRAPDLGAYSFHRASDGRAMPRCPVHPSTTLVIEARGYRRRTLSLAPFLEAPPGDGPHRITIEPGILRSVRVETKVAHAKYAPVAGASVFAGAKRLGTTDADGLFRIDITVVPENGITVVADGYAKATWHPSDDAAELEPGWIPLDAQK